MENEKTDEQGNDGLDFQDFEIEEVLNRFVDVYGKDGELFAIGFQNDRAFLDTFGTQYS